MRGHAGRGGAGREEYSNPRVSQISPPLQSHLSSPLGEHRFASRGLVWAEVRAVERAPLRAGVGKGHTGNKFSRRLVTPEQAGGDHDHRACYKQLCPG